MGTQALEALYLFVPLHPPPPSSHYGTHWYVYTIARLNSWVSSCLMLFSEEKKINQINLLLNWAMLSKVITIVFNYLICISNLVFFKSYVYVVILFILLDFHVIVLAMGSSLVFWECTNWNHFRILILISELFCIREPVFCDFLFFFLFFFVWFFSRLLYIRKNTFMFGKFKLFYANVLF